jgi:nucleotide-binding universal stress UspA family protein
MSANYSILVPVDGSANSLRALSVACEYARSRREATVVALNVQPAMPSSRINPRAVIRDHHERMSAEVFQKVKVVAKRENVQVQQVMLVGMPAQVIARQAIRRHAKEIVMGTRGLGAVKGLFMGSVAMKVVHLTKLPVTLVK